MSVVARLITPDAVTVFFDGGRSPQTMRRQSPQFIAVLAGLRENRSEADLRRLFLLEHAVSSYSIGAVTIKDGKVYFRGEAIGSSVADRILRFMSEGLPWQPLARFLERLMENPSRRSVETLYPFLEYSNLAITDDGFILGYKAITADWYDKHTRRIFNGVGTKVPRMPRNQVDDDPDRGCSYGYHFGNLNYVRGFASGYGTPGGDRIVIVKVDPADIVAVPRDCEHQKVRCVQYSIVDEFTGALPEYVGSFRPVVFDDDPDLEVIPGSDLARIRENDPDYEPVARI